MRTGNTLDFYIIGTSIPSSTIVCSSNQYYDTTTSSCLLCPTGCASCSSSTIFLTCISGYLLSGYTCNQGCSSNCVTCSSPTVCTLCNTSYMLDENNLCIFNDLSQNVTLKASLFE